MSKTFIVCLRVWLWLIAVWFLAVACLYFYLTYQIHLACAQVDRFNAAVLVLQTGPKPRIGYSLTLKDLVKRGLIPPTDANGPETGTIYYLQRVPELGQPGALVKYQDAIGHWHIYPSLDPSWDLDHTQAATSLSPN